MSTQLPTQLTGIHVLQVEDEPDSAELLFFVFRDAGAEVVEANSAFEALHGIEMQSSRTSLPYSTASQCLNRLD